MEDFDRFKTIKCHDLIGLRNQKGKIYNEVVVKFNCYNTISQLEIVGTYLSECFASD